MSLNPVPDSILIALLEFPALENVQAFVDEDYARFGKSRRDGSLSNFYVIDDTDLAGTIPYIEKDWWVQLPSRS